MDNLCSYGWHNNVIHPPFGMLLVGRTWGSEDYRYGFNGKENTDEIYGNDNALDFGARIYDPRLGRWFRVDPEGTDYADWSPYNFGMNTPIQAFDPDGKRTYFIGGAGYNPHPGIIGRFINNHFSPGGNFTTETETAFTNLLGDDFKMVGEAHMPAGMITGSIFSLAFGSKPIQRISTFKNVERTVTAIVNDYNGNKLNADGSLKPLNLIGSSYGSVMVAQAAIAILANGSNNITYIESVTLSASPIAQTSDLYQQLEKLHQEGKIGEIIYDANPNDNVTGAAANSMKEGLKNLGRLLKGSPSILSSKHPHNVNAKDKKRTYDRLMKKTLVEKNIEGDKVKHKAEHEIENH